VFRDDHIDRYGARPGYVPERASAAPRHQTGGENFAGAAAAGQAAVRAAKPSSGIDGFLGLLAGKKKKVASIKEMNEAAARGWSGKR